MQMHGGSYGIGRGHINGIGIFATHKATPQIFTDLRTTEQIAVAGDAHVFRIQVVGNRALFTMPAACGPSDFRPRSTYPPARTFRGFLDLDVTFYQRTAPTEQDAKIKRFTAAPVFTGALEPFMELKRGKYIIEHENERTFSSEIPALVDCARDRNARAKVQNA